VASEGGGPLEPVRRAWENLNERERRLVGILGAVTALLLVGVPLYLSTASISDLESENREMATVIREIGRARTKLSEREAERRATEQRYQTKAPALGSFLEAKAREVELSVREVTDQPEKVAGGFRRRSVRATLPGVGLRAVIDLMASIENSPYPVAIDQIHIEHYQSGDRYNVTLGVVAYDRLQPAGPTKMGAPRPSTARSGVAGPPPP
jgi:hypothetical protein